jgi:hypothetical protein
LDSKSVAVLYQWWSFMDSNLVQNCN